MQEKSSGDEANAVRAGRVASCCVVLSDSNRCLVVGSAAEMMSEAIVAVSLSLLSC